MAVREQFDLVFNFRGGESTQKINQARRELQNFETAADRAGKRSDAIGKSLRAIPTKGLRTATNDIKDLATRVETTSRTTTGLTAVFAAIGARASTGFTSIAAAIGLSNRELSRNVQLAQRAQREFTALASAQRFGSGTAALGGGFGGRQAPAGGGFGVGAAAGGLVRGAQRAGSFLGPALGIGAGLSAFAVAAEIKQFATESVRASASAERLSLSIDVLARNFNVSRSSMRQTEEQLKRLGLTTVQSLNAIQRLTRAGASQAEILTLVEVAMDAAARKGLTLNQAVDDLALGIERSSPLIIDNLGIVIKLGEVNERFAKSLGLANAETLTAEQRAKALIAAIVEENKRGGEFDETTGTLSRNLIDLGQETLRFGENLGTVFSPATNAAVAKLLELLEDFNEASRAAAALSDFTVRVTEESRRQPRAGLDRVLGRERGLGTLDLFARSEIRRRGPGAPGDDGQLPDFIRQSNEDIKKFQARVDQAAKEVEESGGELGKAVEQAEKSSRDLLVSTRTSALSGFERVDAEFRNALEEFGARDRDIAALRARFNPNARIAEFREASGVTPTGEQIAQIQKLFDPSIADGLIRRLREVRVNLTEAFSLQRLAAFKEQIEDINKEFDDINQKNRDSFAAARVEAPGLTEAQEAALFVSRRDANSRLAAAIERRAVLAEAAASSVNREAQGRGRILELVSAEGEASRGVAALRIQAVVREFEIRSRIADTENDRLRLALQTVQEIRDAQLQADADVAAARRAEVEQFREAVGQAFDAAIQDGSLGFQEFLQTQLRGIQRTIAQNLGEEFFNLARGGLDLELPGLRRNGELTGLGRIFRGTPFGSDNDAVANQTAAIQASTQAEIQLREALDLLRGAIAEAEAKSGGVVSAAGGAAGFAGAVSGLPVREALDVARTAADAATRSSEVSQDQIRELNKAREDALDPTAILQASRPSSAEIEVQTTASKAASDAAAAAESSSRAAGILRDAGTLGFGAAAGAFGISSGIRRGGVGGAIQTAGGVASVVSAVNDVATFIPGPAGDALKVAASAATLIGGLFGGKTREEFDREIAEALEANRSDLPPSQGREFDLEGRETDFDFMGRIRPVVVNDQRQFNVSAIDARSLMERGPELLDAMMPAIQGGHPMVGEFRQQLQGG